MKRIVLFAAVLVLALAPGLAVAQPTILSLSSEFVPDRNIEDFDPRDELKVTVSIQLGPDTFPYELGTLQPIFTFNQDALEFIEGAYEFNGVLEEGSNASGEEFGYSTLTVTNSGGGNEVQVNMALAGSSSGPDVPTTPFVLVEIYFKIKDMSATTMLTFDEVFTEVFQSDNVTQVPNSQITFFGEDAVLPVELTDFTVVLDGAGGARLQWATASERGNSGFDVEHAFEPVKETVVSTEWGEEGTREDESDLAIPHDYLAKGFVEGAGTTLEAQTYEFALADLEPGVHRFRLKQIDYDGAFSYSPEVELNVGVEASFGLSPNYPNPFADATTMRFSVAKTGDARVVIYDLLGRLVERVYEGEAEAGKIYRMNLDGSRLASGQYLVVLTSAGERATQTVTLVR
jgi:hypothetical protein